MRRLVCAVVLSIGMLMGCGGTTEMNTPDTVDSVKQGLACRYPNNYCPSGTFCIVCEGLCRKPCPPSGICTNGSTCLIAECGTPYCIY